MYNLSRKDVSKTWGFPLATFTENKRKKKKKNFLAVQFPTYHESQNI